IRKAVSKLLTEARDCYQDDLLPTLAEAGIHILGYPDLDHRQQAYVKKYFAQVVFPVLTPLAFDPGRPFPHISNLSLNLAVLIRDRNGLQHFARVKGPDSLPQLVPVSGSVSRGKYRRGTKKIELVWLEGVIAANLGALFPGMEVIEAYPFH